MVHYSLGIIFMYRMYLQRGSPVRRLLFVNGYFKTNHKHRTCWGLYFFFLDCTHKNNDMAIVRGIEWVEYVEWYGHCPYPRCVGARSSNCQESHAWADDELTRGSKVEVVLMSDNRYPTHLHERDDKKTHRSHFRQERWWSPRNFYVHLVKGPPNHYVIDHSIQVYYVTVQSRSSQTASRQQGVFW